MGRVYSWPGGAFSPRGIHGHWEASFSILMICNCFMRIERAVCPWEMLKIYLWEERREEEKEKGMTRRKRDNLKYSK